MPQNGPILIISVSHPFTVDEKNFEIWTPKMP